MLLQNILLLATKPKRTLWEEFLYEIKDVLNDFKELFDLIKANTYDILCANYGSEIVNLLLIGLLFFLLCIFATVVIRH